MSDFEYASVVVSIVLALGIADILRFIGDTVRELDVRRLYWVHFLWILVLLSLHVEFWWRMWDFRHVLYIGPRLAFLLVGPALLFVATRTLLPASDDRPNEEFFYRRKSAFFAIMILLSLWSLAFSPWSVSMESGQSLITIIVVSVIVIALFTACVFSDNSKLHKGVVSMVVLLELIEMLSWSLPS